MGIKVKLRQAPISGNRKSLYLDFYPAVENIKNGKFTRREYLKMYVFDNPKNPVDKQHNKDTLGIAEQIRQKRDNILNKPEVYTDFEREQLKVKAQGEKSFVDYFEKLVYKKEGSNQSNWISTLNYIKSFKKGTIKFSDINVVFCNDFRDYLLTAKSHRSDKTNLSQNSAASYFSNFKAALRQSYQDDFLPKDINQKVKSIKPVETRREFLTLEELNALVKTPCNDLILKSAALFSALTGLRFSDIQKLTWSEVEYIEGQGHFLNFKQQKTKGIENLPISKQAFEFFGEQGELDDLVFKGLKYSAYHNKHLFQWIGAAGITKNITFHCFRHTYAVLQLANGTDIYTVSKMLGHRELKTTQIYAKIVDESKREATNKIKLDI